MAQSVQCPTFYFSSGHDLNIMTWSTTLELHTGSGVYLLKPPLLKPVYNSLSAPQPHLMWAHEQALCVCVLKKKNKNKTRNCEFLGSQYNKLIIKSPKKIRKCRQDGYPLRLRLIVVRWAEDLYWLRLSRTISWATYLQVHLYLSHLREREISFTSEDKKTPSDFMLTHFKI